MTERAVQIPVDKMVWEKIRNAKKELTYSQYLQKIMESS